MVDRAVHDKVHAMYYIREAAKQLEEERKSKVMQRIETFFKEADVDNSGSLTLTELTHALQKQGYPGNEDDIRKFFHRADSSGDEEVQYDEYLEVMSRAPMTMHSKAAMKAVFKMFDKDGNGKIDKGELLQVFHELGKLFTDEDVKFMMEAADKDSSGFLEYDEFIEIVTGEEQI